MVKDDDVRVGNNLEVNSMCELTCVGGEKSILAKDVSESCTGRRLYDVAKSL